MAQSQAESTRDIYSYGKYINQFPPNTIKAIRQSERIQKKICRQKMSIMFNEICINEEMLPKYTYIYRVEFSGEEVIVLPLAFMASLFIDELRSWQPFERMYVNNSNCDS